MTPFEQPAMHPQRWGDPAREAELPEGSRGLVELVFGVRETPALSQVHPPASTATEELLSELRGIVGDAHVLVDDAARVARTRGKSTPDLLQAREGDLAAAPDVVVRPDGHDEVSAVIACAVRHHVAVVPLGGGTAVTGGLVADRDGFAAVISLDLGRMKRLLRLDETSHTATLEPGLRGPEAEALLNAHGYMLGHFPQSFEFATIGGFAATRSSGQSSAGYGRFDAMVVALRAATPIGDLVTGVAPASAAGPDLRQVLLGSEGTFGVITEVTVRIRRAPEVKVYEGWRWPSFEAGSAAMRTLAQSGSLPSVLRLSDEAETALNLADPSAIGSEANTGCLMIVGHEGAPARVRARQQEVAEILTGLGGVAAGTEPGEKWAHGRFDAPYLRDSLLDLGVLVETLETATFWSQAPALYAAVKESLVAGLGEGAIVLCHISHVYETGCSLYFTVAAAGHEDRLTQWAGVKEAVNAAIVDNGGTITHHHAIGTDHRAALAREVGPVGVQVLRGLKQSFDPTGVLNPGVLVP